MFNNKLFNMALILLIAIALLLTVMVLLYKYVLVPDQLQASGNHSPSIKEIVEHSVATGEITTNLSDGDIAVLEFTIVADGEKGKEEVEQGMFLVKREIIGVVSSMTAEDLKGEEGVMALEARIMNRINSFLQTGKVVKVVTTNKIVQ